MLTADTDMEIGINGLAEVDGHLHELTYACLVKLGEGISLEDLLVVVCIQELSCVVSGETEGHLRKVVCTEAEECGLLGDLISRESCSGDLDHGSYFVLDIGTCCCDLLISRLNDYILNELELLDLTHEGDHDLGLDIPVGMSLLNVDGGADDGSCLHPGDLGICNRKTASSVTHHGVELVEGCDHHLDVLNGPALLLGEFLDIGINRGDELVERGIQEPDGYGITLESLIESLKVGLLHGKDNIESCLSFLNCLGADHLTESVDPSVAEEHVLRTAQTDTLGTEFPCLLSICGSIRICSYLKSSCVVSPLHYTSELTCDLCIDRGDNAVVDAARGTVDGDLVSLAELLACELEYLVLLIHLDVGATGNAACTHTSCNNCSVGCHTASYCEDTLGGLHSLDVLGGCLESYENHLLAPCCPCLCIVSREDDLTGSCSGGCCQGLGQRCGLLKDLCIKLGVKESVEVSGVDHRDCLLLCPHAFVNEITCDLESSLGRSLTVSCLEHVELAGLDRELHVLHVSIVCLKDMAYIRELGECLGEFILHLGDVHGCSYTCNNVLTLGVCKELTEKSLVTRSGVTGEGNAGTAIVTHVTEGHGLNVNGSTPGIGDIVVSSVYVCSGIVPGTEDGLDGTHELFLGIRGEVASDLGLVLGLELCGKFLEVVGGKVNVLLDAPCFLHLIDELLEVLLTDFHNNVGIHLDESSVAVPCPPGVIGLLGNDFNNVLVEAEVQDRIHHAGHRCSCSGSDGNEKRVLEVSEFLAGDLFHLSDVLHDLSGDLIIDHPAVFVVLRTCLGGDREALGNRKSQVGHLGKVCTFTAEQFAHVSVTFGKEINILCHLNIARLSFLFCFLFFVFSKRTLR